MRLGLRWRKNTPSPNKKGTAHHGLKKKRKLPYKVVPLYGCVIRGLSDFCLHYVHLSHNNLCSPLYSTLVKRTASAYNDVVRLWLGPYYLLCRRAALGSARSLVTNEWRPMKSHGCKDATRPLKLSGRTDGGLQVQKSWPCSLLAEPLSHGIFFFFFPLLSC